MTFRPFIPCTSEIYLYGVGGLTLMSSLPQHPDRSGSDGFGSRRNAKEFGGKQFGAVLDQISGSVAGRCGVGVPGRLSGSEFWRLRPTAKWQSVSRQSESRFWQRERWHHQGFNGCSNKLRGRVGHDQQHLGVEQVFFSDHTQSSDCDRRGAKHDTQRHVQPERRWYLRWDDHNQQHCVESCDHSVSVRNRRGNWTTGGEPGHRVLRYPHGGNTAGPVSNPDQQRWSKRLHLTGSNWRLWVSAERYYGAVDAQRYPEHDVHSDFRAADNRECERHCDHHIGCSESHIENATVGLGNCCVKWTARRHANHAGAGQCGRRHQRNGYGKPDRERRECYGYSREDKQLSVQCWRSVPARYHSCGPEHSVYGNFQSGNVWSSQRHAFRYQ